MNMAKYLIFISMFAMSAAIGFPLIRVKVQYKQTAISDKEHSRLSSPWPYQQIKNWSAVPLEN